MIDTCEKFICILFFLFIVATLEKPELPDIKYLQPKDKKISKKLELSLWLPYDQELVNYGLLVYQRKLYNNKNTDLSLFFFCKIHSFMKAISECNIHNIFLNSINFFI